jgi:hypothetical protein
MSAAKTKLFRWGWRVAVTYGVATHLMFLLKENEPEYLFCLILALVHLAIALPGLLFSGDHQVEWYRLTLFLPLVSIWGTFLPAATLDLSGLAYPIFLATAIVFLGAPLVWLIGAIVIRRPHIPGRAH